MTTMMLSRTMIGTTSFHFLDLQFEEMKVQCCLLYTSDAADEEDTPFQVDESDSTPNLADVDVDVDVPLVAQEENENDDNGDAEVEAVEDGSEDTSHDGLLDDDDDAVEDDDRDDFFSLS